MSEIEFEAFKLGCGVVLVIAVLVFIYNIVIRSKKK